MYGIVWKRWKKVAIDGDLIGEYGFSCGVANTRVFLDRKFPCVRGQSVLKSRLLPHVQVGSNFGEVPFFGAYIPCVGWLSLLLTMISENFEVT